MVEFGLKLEDNKVDQWADRYIDYEKLKAVLKRAKISAEQRDDLIKRMPPGAAAEVIQERLDRSATASHRVDSPPTSVPLKMEPMEVSQSSASLTGATDSTPLLGEPKPSMKRMNSWGSFSEFSMGDAVKKVTSYLGLADDRALLLQAYDNADEKLNLFRETYEQEVSSSSCILPLRLILHHPNFSHNIIQVNKVKDFYQKKTNEISERMEVLVESVDTSGLNLNKQRQKQQKRMSVMESMTQRFETMMQGMQSSSERSDFLESLDDEEDPGRKKIVGDLEKKKEKEEMVRKSDSIKRAITDIYRTAKLLHNYSIMVSELSCYLMGTKSTDITKPLD